MKQISLAQHHVSIVQMLMKRQKGQLKWTLCAHAA